MRFVKYIGPSHVRQITARDWQGVGIQADTLVWSARNGFAVPLDALTENQITKAIDPDPFFVITGDDEEFKPTPMPVEMTPDQHRQAVEEPVNVVALLNGDDNVSTTDSGAAGAPGSAAPTSTGRGRGSGHDEP